MLHISSRYRTQGTFDDFTVQVPPTQGKCVRLLDAAIPQTQYVINENNNVLSFTEVLAGPTINTYTATLTPGSYSASALAAELKTQMEVPSALTYTVSYDSITNTFTISTTETFILSFSVAGSPAAQLGFDTVDTDLAMSVTSTRGVNLSPPLYLFLSIEGLGLPSVKVASLQPAGGNFPLVMQGNSYTVSIFGSQTSYSVDLRHTGNSGNLRVRLTDADGKLAGIRSDWAFTLLLE